MDNSSNDWHGTRPYDCSSMVHIVWICQRDQPDMMVGTFVSLERAEEEIEWLQRQVQNKTSLNTLVTDFYRVEDIIDMDPQPSTRIQTVPVKI